MLLFDDADTGHEIIVFLRRGKWICYLRHRITKRFIKRLIGFSIWTAFLFEYPRGKRGNPLYVDLKVGTSVKPEDAVNYFAIEEKMIDAGLNIIREYFGTVVAGLSQVVGVEYSSILAKKWHPNGIAYLVWHHYKNDFREREIDVWL
jgi:hypothetical protein